MVSINDRYDMGLDIRMLAIDEGIRGYRDDSLECVHRAQQRYGLPLTVLSYTDLYKGWTMDRIVATIGNKSTCTHCGILRRQALEKGAVDMEATVMATGHNADDSIETLLMNCKCLVLALYACLRRVCGRVSCVWLLVPASHPALQFCEGIWFG